MTEQLPLRISVPLLKKRIVKTHKVQVQKRIVTISLINPPLFYRKTRLKGGYRFE
jgi:hypothetical protein